MSSTMIGIAILGVGVGYVAGMFGIGGGFLMTPLLVAIFRMPLPIAVGTGLCQMIGTSLVSFLRHRDLRQGEPRIDLLMLPGSLLGVELGARTLTALGHAGTLRIGGIHVPAVNAVVESAYILLLGWVALSYLRHRREVLEAGPLARVRLGPKIDLPAVGLKDVSAVLVAYLGLALGFASGFLGIGGGVAMNPILIYGYGFPIRQAVGTGIVVLFVTAVVGTGVHATRGHVDLKIALVLLVGATISAQLGALASRRMSNTLLARVHAAVLVAAIGAVVWDLVRHVR